MFTKEFAARLIKIIDERELTVESLANTVGLTREYVSDIKNGHRVPSLNSLEKFCSGLGLEPNDLLLNEKSFQGDRSKAKRVTTMYCPKEEKTPTYTPICPTCNSLLHNDWESYCDHCGQRLSWERYNVDAKVVHDKPKIKKEMRD